MRIGRDEYGNMKWSFAQIWIFETIERFQHDDKLLLSVKNLSQMSGHSKVRVRQVLNSLVKGKYLEKIKNFNPEDVRVTYYYVWYPSLDLDDLNYYGYDKYLKKVNGGGDNEYNN